VPQNKKHDELFQSVSLVPPVPDTYSAFISLHQHQSLCCDCDSDSDSLRAFSSSSWLSYASNNTDGQTSSFSHCLQTIRILAQLIELIEMDACHYRSPGCFVWKSNPQVYPLPFNQLDETPSVVKRNNKVPFVLDTFSATFLRAATSEGMLFSFRLHHDGCIRYRYASTQQFAIEESLHATLDFLAAQAVSGTF
jgi:hypothetical protein